ncbi:hypothetical protein KQ940_09475 [Marinobacterium sp. D7]|uniref:MMPL family transporter n=1 Tax=Marinobacterium ramblicola TaxID=2849041 RepID=UPI001C2D2D2A|nr:hypothetical protein [Marinobacterium ramblicola]MBV1788285.1 hypothetical protein [Marinobacterium ramblicola]
MVLALCFSAWQKGVAFDTSLMALLPEAEQQPLIKRATDQLAASYADKLLLVVSAEDELKAQTAVKQLAAGLQPLQGVAHLTWLVPPSEQAMDDLFPYRFILLSEEVRSRLSREGGAAQFQLALQRLLNPLSGFTLAPLRDPFSLYTDLMLSLQSDLPVRIENGLLRLVASEQPSYLLTLELLQDPFSLPVQQAVNKVLEPLLLEQRQNGITIRCSGLLLHAAAGAEQARAEMSSIGLGSLLGIVLLILVVFRSLFPFWLVLLPVLVGSLVAVAVTLLLFGRIHLITAAFGAGLIGVAVDYALHFICESRVVPERTISRLFAGLLLGLLSSIAAYAALALAPFPGLRQMALFCVLGLVGAWITVLLWLPLLNRQRLNSPLVAAQWLDRWRNAYPRVENTRWLMPLLLVLGLISGAVIWQGGARDDIALLQTSPKALLDEDRQVQSWLGNGSSAAFLLISGRNFEQVLRTEERLQPRLAQLQGQALLAGYTALSQVLPSQQRQRENAALVQELYANHWPQLAGILQLSRQQSEQAQALMEQGSEAQLTPRRWLELAASQAWAPLIISSGDGEAATVIRLQGTMSPALKQALIELAAAEPEVFFVDRVSDISELITRYRSEIIDWLLLAYTGVMLMLMLRYRWQFWRIVLPPLLGSLITFAGFLLLNDGYNLFNLIALMLVLGIGLDMGIFLSESSDSDHTWLAVSLSAVSSLLAFGLLALSQTPVLYHFGIIVLPGLALTWLLAPLMRAPSTGETKQ